ncbi:MAG: winged helix-turn-helix domain-containing protein [Candidatus Hodarchaeota archaeon]
MIFIRKKYKNEDLEFRVISKNESLPIMSDPDKKAKKIKSYREKVLQGKTLRIYWYFLTHNRAGVREIQKALKISSPGTVSYQINKLVKAGIISKNEEDGKYYVKEEVKKGMLGFYFRLGSFMIPRFSLYLGINIMGFVGYVFFASVYGDVFIANPGSILLLFFLIFSTIVFIFESIKILERKPTKVN